MQTFFNKNRRQSNKRNVFDLSQTRVFSAPLGALLPCYGLMMNPNEDVKISVNDFIRTQPLNSPAFARFRQNIDFFFVPLRQVVPGFENFITNTDYPFVSVSSEKSDVGSFNTIPTFQLRDLASSLDGVTSNDEHGFPIKSGAKRIADLLGYGNVDAYSGDAISTSQPVTTSANILRALCYQKVYYDHYYNTNFGKLDNSNWLIEGSTLGVSFPFSKFFRLRYAPYNKDMFTSSQPRYLFTPFMRQSNKLPAVVNPPYGESIVNGSLFDINTPPVSDRQQSVSDGGLDGDANNSITVPHLKLGVGNMITMDGLRALKALEMYLTNSSAAYDGSYRSQIYAHYGYEVKHDPQRSIRVGSVSSPFLINDVLTTANTDGGQTGDLYGQSRSSLDGNKSFEFHSNEHGFLIGLFHLSPDTMYSSKGLEHDVLFTNYVDFFQPEFADLGLAPLNSALLDPRDNIATPFNLKTPKIVGFNNRYLGYKTQVDRAYWPFYSYIRRSNNSVKSGSLSAWTMCRDTSLEVGNSSVSSYSEHSYYIDPALSDSVTSVNYDGSPDTDFTLIQLSVNCKVIRPMSVDGIPALESIHV